MASWPGAVEADFEQYYQRDLADLWRKKKNGQPKLTTRKAAVLLMHLPRGANVWRHTGGAGAIGDEVEALWSVEHTLVMQAWGQAPRSKRGAKPKPREYPKPLFEADRKREQFERNAAAFRRKHLSGG